MNKKENQFIVIRGGNHVLSVVQQAGDLEVIGVTSRGFFLIERENHQILFVTLENECSPLTLNITPNQQVHFYQFLNQNSLIGKKAYRNKKSIIFYEPSFCINCSQATAWQTDDLKNNFQALPERVNYCRSVTESLYQKKGDAGYTGFLIPFLDIVLTTPENPLSSDETFLKIMSIHNWLIQGNLKLISEIYSNFFAGRGRGLTPSGDDLFIGLLLSASRAPSINPFFSLEEEFIGGVIRSAREKTTAVSAAIITSATQGQADERLITALDGILTGQIPPGEASRRLAAWGNSSGADALLGMMLYLL